MNSADTTLPEANTPNQEQRQHPERHSLHRHAASDNPANNPASNPGSISENSWHQASDSLALLALAVAQIDTSLHEGNQSIEQLTASFNTMADCSSQISALHAEQQPLSAEQQAQLAEQTSTLQNEIQQSITAFQFYDRLSQRLEHVGQSLEKMGHLIADNKARQQSEQWQDLQQQIKGNYTMEAERIMFEHIMAGHSIAEALEIYHHHFSKDDSDNFGTDDEIELF